MKFCVWLWLFLLVFNSQLLAQPFAARNLSLQQGLPEYYASGIVQDKAGFIWIATRDGLARYDGHRFKLFRHQVRNPRSLANNVITSLQVVSDSALLLQFDTYTFQLFNPQTEQFRNLLTRQRLDQDHVQVNNVTMTADEWHFWGRLNRQLIHYEPHKDRITRYSLPNVGLRDGIHAGNKLLIDSIHQCIYTPFPGGMAELNTRTGQYHVWPFAPLGQQGTLETYYGIPLAQRANGELLTAAPGRLITFEPRTHRFQIIPIPDKLSTLVGVLHCALDGNTYFTYGMTVYRLTPGNQITPLWTAPRVDYQNYFHALLLDRSGVLWVGTNGDGVEQIDLRALPIKTYPYQTNYLADLLSIELHLNAPDWTRVGDLPFTVRWGNKGNYLGGWVENAYRLLRSDPAQHKLRQLLVIPPKTFHEGNGLRVMAHGQLWLYNPADGLYKVDSAGRLLATWPVLLDRVSDIQPIGSWIWFSTSFNGLYAYDLHRRRIVRHLRYQAADSTSLISDQVWCLAADPADSTILWVGTQEGLSRLDTRTMRCQNWTEQQGLPNATINCLLTDTRHRLWFSTLQGISRLDPRTGRMRHFTTDDGLLDTEYKLQHGAELPDGRLAFGGATGMTVFDPLALEDSPRPIPVALTALRIGNVPIEPSPLGSPLTRPLNATPTLQLTHTQNFLSLEYAGLQYNKPTTLEYRYQLTGVDADWVYVGNQTVANYTQLDPGSYTFRVNAADTLGHWNPLVKTLRIVIAPPWWQTWWAYGVYSLVLIALVRAYIQYRINRAQLRQDMALQEQEARLIKANADWQTRFFTNITHEFRTPLTLILAPLEKLLDMPVLPPRASLFQQLGVMHRNAGRLLRLINQLLDMAKLEAGQLSVVQSRGNLAGFFAELVDSFRLRAERKGVQLTYEATDMPTDSLFDAHKLETIGYNLLDNALKFTPAGGHIQILLRQAESSPGPSFQLQVIDSGMGIPAEQLPRIFDRFYQGRQIEGSTGAGTGIGLFLISEFARMLGGKVWVESQPGQGTMFTVSLPLQPSTATQTDHHVPSPSPLLGATATEPAPEAVALSGTESADAPLVLIVEDNDELREFMAGELASSYRVLTAANGQEGWQVCLAELPNLVISDVMMPIMDGFTLVERIKTNPLTAHIAVILLTAKTMADARIQGLTAGANDYLTKPFHGQELHLRIHNLLRHQQQLRQHWQQQMGQLASPTTPVTKPKIDDPFLVKLYQVLDRELANSTFSVEQLADELAVSYRTLHRKVNTLTGTSANELIRIYRLQQAAGFLQEGCSISETAEKAGFEGQSYFAKLFKGQFGMTPTAFLLAQGRA